METRASYIAVGAFVLVLVLGLVGFVIWVGKFRTQEEFARYDILFSGSVTGLQVDGTVRYRGVSVGRIIDIAIDPLRALPSVLLAELRERLEESEVPYDVDIVDLSAASPEIRASVEREGARWSG